MNDTLDNENILTQRDPEGALNVAAEQFTQAAFDAVVESKDNDGREITSIVVTGMGGSALAALVAKVWLKFDITVPFEVIRGYDLPAYVNHQTLVIASSYSGNTEETVSALNQANAMGTQVAVIASGGKLVEIAEASEIARVKLPGGLQPRMAVIYNLRALLALFENFGIVHDKLQEIEALSQWLGIQSSAWGPKIPTEQNYAKQLAKEAVGKTPVFYGGALTAPVAYKWKISFNENAKNVAFWNEYPEFNHNEFLGWTSHPVEKPFAVFDLISQLEHPQIIKRFEISDRLLSGMRPKATVVNLVGESVIAQLLWASILADFVSIYVAILNGVDPTPVELIEKFKKEL
ncbi:bifunctional phosphoglucose/phosphomannose isomerase [Candidatus Saccharibacteria bacterium]|nr:bifunctional phosphoglucose/phosphomannose isomerase [Candidatus Saccharibacteria bacterium]